VLKFRDGHLGHRRNPEPLAYFPGKNGKNRIFSTGTGKPPAVLIFANTEIY